MIENIRHSDRGLTVHVCTGRIAGPEITAAIRELYVSEPTNDHLWDFRDADLSDISSADVAALARLPKQLKPDRIGRRTALVTGQAVGFGLSRMYEALAGLAGQAVEVRVFRSLDEAGLWLDEGDGRSV